MESLNEQLGRILSGTAGIVPELVLAAGLLIVLASGLFNNRNNLLPNALTLLTSLISFGLIATGGLQRTSVLFDGMLQRDGFADFLMLLVDAAVALTCLMSIRHPSDKKFSEYYTLILAIALGSHFLLLSTHLMVAFLSLELISICSYVLVGYAFNKRASEGSLKYFLFGAVASSVMLYGFTLLYGMTGTLQFTSIAFAEGLAANASPLLLMAGLMGLSGFLFKMAAVPMQPWAPDVYEAAPMPVIALLSVAPKLAGIGILTRFLLALHMYGEGPYDWQLIAAMVAILSIAVGNLSALWQKDPKRMMAYSSIAHAGFLLVGVASFMPEGLHFMLFYAGVYLLMNFAVFTYLYYFEAHGIFSIADHRGQGKHFVLASTGLAVALIALTGIPPTAGFTAKLFIFSGLWEAYQTTQKDLLIWLLIFGLLNTVISLFFYLRIPWFAFLKAAAPAPVEKKGSFENYLALILVVLIVVIFFLPGLLMGLINRINFAL